MALHSTELERGYPLSPLIKGSRVKLLARYSVECVVEQWQQQFQLDIADELVGVSEILLYQCIESGLKFFYPFSIAGSDKLYEKLGVLDWYYMPDKWEYDLALAEMDLQGRILEVGAGRGFFQKKLVQRQAKNSMGIDLNPEGVRLAQEQSLPVFNNNLFDLVATDGGQFDTVCSFQVLEHLPNPLEMLTAMVDLLKSCGKLILSTPNAQSYIQHQDYPLLDMPPHHMARWSAQSYKSLETVLPVTLKKIAYEPLALYHCEEYARIFLRRIFPNQRLRKRMGPFIYQILIGLLLRSNALRNQIKGHTIYACFKKKAN